MLKHRVRKLALMLKREVDWGLRLKKKHDLRVCWWNTRLAFAMERDLHVCWWNARLAFGIEKRLLCLAWGHVWSFVISNFWQHTEISPKFLKLRPGRILKYFRLHAGLNLHDCTCNLLNCLELDPIWMLVFVSVLLNNLKSPGKITVSIQKRSLKLFLALICLSVYYWTGWIVGFFYQCTVKLCIISVMPRSRGYGDITVTYIRRPEIPSHIYVKHQYMQESE